MKLASLLSVFPQLNWGDAANLEALEITHDSRNVKPGSVFVAIRGATSDGHHFLAQVAATGAVALVVEDAREIPASYRGAVVIVPSTRRALDLLAEKFFGSPADNLFCIGVTGTNGKTTVTYMIEAILTRFGWPTGVMGTIDHHLATKRWVSHLTTPDALTMQRRLKEFVSLGARAVTFEVSSHALDQARVDSLPFAVGIFTNFTRDHLDYHQNMEDYFATKEKLFRDLLGQKNQVATAVLNGDDPWIRRLHVREGIRTWWFGQEQADFQFKALREDLNGSLFHLTTPHGSVEISLPSPGRHNIYNAAAAIAATVAAGVSLNTAAEALQSFYGAPGRLEKVPNERDLFVFVDYAHTDDAVRTVLRALSQARAASRRPGRVITVFGCGGDRDQGKRPLMAKAAAEFSDILIMTSDNPRTEDPFKILEQVRAGVPRDWPGEQIVEPDRRAALGRALQSAREGDVILVAGKGHEDYQIVGTEKLPFSDQLVLRELLKT